MPSAVSYSFFNSNLATDGVVDLKIKRARHADLRTFFMVVHITISTAALILVGTMIGLTYSMGEEETQSDWL
jgi:hypothetical protein